MEREGEMERNQRIQRWGEKDRWSKRRRRDNPKNVCFFSIHKKNMYAAF